jgi:glycerol-3-phosphate acyltransferase PlsX
LRIAVDGLGGDHAPGEVIGGALAAAVALPSDAVILVGDDASLRPHLLEQLPPNVSIEKSGEAIAMSEDPSAALRRRPDASAAVAARMVRRGDADAFFSAGSTGATVAAALLGVGRLKGCRRPAIATILPLSSPVLLLDAGATVQCRPHDLLVFAILGAVFARRYFGLEEPARVGLVNVGEEPGKGTDLVREAYTLLRGHESLRFVGNVEGRDVATGVADVLVTDGFTGNVLLKTAEGVAKEVLGLVRSAMMANLPSKLAASVLRPNLMKVRDRVDPENYGGSFLLGVAGSVAIGHGNSRARGVENALRGISATGTGLTNELQAALAGIDARPAREDAG